MIITLCGFPGVGKSIIGNALAVHLANINIQTIYFDLDSYIEAREKKSIANILKEIGEEKFRISEYNYLKELISQRSDHQEGRKTIISLGGGTLNYFYTRELIKKDTICIFLNCTKEILAERLSTQEEITKRPLLYEYCLNELVHSGEKEKLETAIKTEELQTSIIKWIETIFKERTKIYAECSNFEIDTTIWNQEEIINSIIQKLNLEN